MVGVAVAVDTTVAVGVFVGEAVELLGVDTEVDVAVDVAMGPDVAVGVDAKVDVAVGVFVADSVGVFVGVGVDTEVDVTVGVFVCAAVTVSFSTSGKDRRLRGGTRKFCRCVARMNPLIPLLASLML